MHEIEVRSSTGNARTGLDVLWFLEVKADFTYQNRSSPYATPARLPSVRETDSTKFAVELDVSRRFMLHFSAVYDPA